MKKPVIISFVFIIFSVQLLASVNSNNGVINNKKPLIAQYANEAVNIEIVDSSQYENGNDSIENLIQKKQAEIGLMKNEQLKAQDEIRKGRMYFTIGIIVVFLVVAAIFIGLIFIVRKSQKN